MAASPLLYVERCERGADEDPSLAQRLEPWTVGTARYERVGDTIDYLHDSVGPPTRVGDVLTVFELDGDPDDVAKALDAAGAAVDADGRRVRILYRRLAGDADLTEWLYTTRWNLPAEEQEGWEAGYSLRHRMHTPGVETRPGLGTGSQYKVVGEPEYAGWSGPSQGYVYLNLFEMAGEEGIDVAMVESPTATAGLDHETSAPKAKSRDERTLTGARCVYHRTART